MLHIFVGLFFLAYMALSLFSLQGGVSLLSEIIDQTRLHVSFLLAFLVLAFSFSRKWVLASLVGVAVLFNLALVFASYFPEGCDAKRGGEVDVLRVLSLNVSIRNSDVEEIGRLVKASGADLVLLIEANPHLVGALHEELADEYPYKTYRYMSEAGRGLVGLSKHKITTENNYRTMGSSRYRFLFFPIDFEGKSINIYGVHFLSPFGSRLSPGDRISIRNQQINSLIEHVIAFNGNMPFIIAGDMNSAPWLPDMLEMRKKLGVSTSVERKSLAGTWPAWLPKMLGVPIDHIYHSVELSRLNGGVIEIQGSDHRGVYVDIGVCR